MKKAILYILACLIFIGHALAIGVVPSHIDSTFEPGKETSYEIKVSNDEDRDLMLQLSVDGDFPASLKLSREELLLRRGEQAVISYRVIFKDGDHRPGIHQARITIKAIDADSSFSRSQIVSQVGVVSKLNINVPYPGKYAEARLVVPNFQDQESSNFAVEVNNLGAEDIVEATAYIDILSPLNEKIITLKSEEVSVPSKGKKIIYISWKPDVPPGNYLARVHLLYDKNDAIDEKPFAIGAPKIDVESISVDSFRLGGIAKFDILVSSLWNQRIEGVFAESRIMGKEGQVFALAKTSSEDILPYGKQELTTFWDTAGISQGDYKLGIDINYLGKKETKEFDIYVAADKIISRATGKVIEPGGKGEGFRAITILIVLVGALVAVNIYLLASKFRGRNR